MWEEIRNKQNEEIMLALLYYARKMYDKSTIIAAINITLILISAIFAMLDIDLKWLTGILFCVFCILECSINKCIKSAAKARATFDAILFGLNTPNDWLKIREKAYKLRIKKSKEFKIQSTNTGMDNPPGVRDWYTINNAKTKNEMILNCQIENTKWDEEITNIDFKIFISILVVVAIILLIICFDAPFYKVLAKLLVGIELIYEIIKRCINYREYNKNLSNRRCLIEQFINTRVTLRNITGLQELINARRELNLVPLNSIHKKIAKTFHEIVKNT